ncbi:hypothetical protein HK096_002568, partial [Nowakowskiella sp. JEL0078]
LQTLQIRVSHKGQIGPGLNGRPNPSICINREDIFFKIDQTFGFLTLSEESSNLTINNAQICILEGVGGSGKTFIATKYAFQRVGLGDIVSWFKADSKKNVESSLINFACWITSKPSLDVETLRFDSILLLVKNAIESKSIIIVLDNVESYKEVRHIIQSLPTIRFLLTTRNPMRDDYDQLLSVKIDFPNNNQAVDFIMKKLARIKREDAVKIVEQCKRIPLRLATTVAYLSNVIFLEFPEERQIIMEKVFVHRIHDVDTYIQETVVDYDNLMTKLIADYQELYHDAAMTVTHKLLYQLTD